MKIEDPALLEACKFLMSKIGKKVVEDRIRQWEKIKREKKK